MSSENPNYDFVLIQGILDLPGNIPGIRKEFSTWATSEPEKSIQVSLFIRALQKFYDTDYTQTLSYFQVASIHGYPGDLRWDNSAPPTFPKNNHYIYCTHNTLAFPTWHRPYMALYEQTLYKLMGEVIENDLNFHTIVEKEAWIAESKLWRLPYWNWAVNTSIPGLFRPKEVSIRVPLSPDGKPQTPETKPNPLYRYQLKVNGTLTKMGDLPNGFNVDDVNTTDPDDKAVTLPWSKCSGTSRWGITSATPTQEQSEGVNNFDSIAKAIDLHNWYGPDGETTEIEKHSVSDLVYRLLSNVHAWASFSSTATSGPWISHDWEQWISLEYIHNNLHGFIGGSGFYKDGMGHMMNVPVAAFDPIFYVHHCYIDSLFALWQTLNENSWFEGDDKHVAELDLSPFHHQFPDKDIRYFNSNDVVDWTEFGYQYDILVKKSGETKEQYIARLVAYVNKTYHGTGDVLLGDEGKLFNNAVKDSEDKYDDYLINIEYDRYGYKNGAPYTIHFFLGAPVTQVEPSANSTGLLEAPRHVGSVFTFSNPIGGGGDSSEDAPSCPNCKKQHDEGVLSRASVPLTISLYRDATNTNIDELNDIVPDDVEPYLREKLSWVAVSTGGRVIPWSELPKTKVFVLKGKSNHFAGQIHKLSVYDEYKSLPGVTEGKEAGAQGEDYGRYQ